MEALGGEAEAARSMGKGWFKSVLNYQLYVSVRKETGSVTQGSQSETSQKSRQANSLSCIIEWA